MEEVTIEVTGMSCQHCKNAVEEAVSELSGVESVTVDLEADQVTINYDQSELEVADLETAITDAGPYEIA